MKGVIIFDVDGVLADFDKGFTTIGSVLYGTPISTVQDQPEYNFRHCMDRKQQDRCWDYLKHSPNWWATLDPIVSIEEWVEINDLCYRYEVYFVTHRMHELTPAGEQTRVWLQSCGVRHPRVIVSSKKGEIARAVKATHAIEDNWGNACAIHWMAESPQCKVFLIERRYNEAARQIIPVRINPIETVGQFITCVREDLR